MFDWSRKLNRVDVSARLLVPTACIVARVGKRHTHTHTHTHTQKERERGERRNKRWKEEERRMMSLVGILSER